MHVYNGLVEKKCFTMPSYTTVGGKLIKNLKVGWESYGQLNERKDNVVLVPHFYSANSHVAGRYRDDDPAPGYWDAIIGPGKAIDTDRFFVLSVDSLVNLNSKDGITITTGPDSIDEETGKPYGLRFPIVTIRDFVRVQKALIDSLGVTKLHAAVGVSMGGLQSFEWATAYPEMVERVIAVNGTASQRPFAMVGLESWTGPIKVDPKWNNGDYYETGAPIDGLAHAFFNVVVAANHPKFIAENFGYKWADENKSPLECLENDFLTNQAFKAVSLARAMNTTDANNMLYMTRANQLFVAGTEGSSVSSGLKNIRAKTLVIQSNSDSLFPSEDARAQVELLRSNDTDAKFIEFDSIAGHIGGVTEIAKVSKEIQAHLES